MKIEEQTKESKIAEYNATQSNFEHYDNLRWQVGSILIAGNFIFWGFIVSSNLPPSPKAIGITCTLVNFLMSIWILFSSQCRQHYLYKLHRIHELERELNMEQHIRIKDQKYVTFGPKGHSLDMLIYIITSLGGSFIGYIRIGFDSWILLPIPIVIFIISLIKINEKKFFRHLEKYDKEKLENQSCCESAD